MVNCSTRFPDAAIFSVEMGNVSSKLSTRGFYIEYRTSVMFAREDPEEAIPHFSSLAEWELVKSTKLDTAARLCQYFLQRDGVPMPTFANGQVHFPSLPLCDEETHECKIVVFTEFPSMIDLFTNVRLFPFIRTFAYTLHIDIQTIRRVGSLYQRIHVLRKAGRNSQKVSYGI